jgi:hypothetical protein
MQSRNGCTSQIHFEEILIQLQLLDEDDIKFISQELAQEGK